MSVTLHDEMAVDQVTLRDEIPAESTHPEMSVTLHDEIAADQVTLRDEIPARDSTHPEMPEEEPAQLTEIPETTTFPVKMKCGRPKGSTTTPIGLPKNKKKGGEDNSLL